MEEYCADADNERSKLLDKICVLENQQQFRKPNLKMNTNSTLMGLNITFVPSDPRDSSNDLDESDSDEGNHSHGNYYLDRNCYSYSQGQGNNNSNAIANNNNLLVESRMVIILIGVWVITVGLITINQVVTTMYFMNLV